MQDSGPNGHPGISNKISPIATFSGGTACVRLGQVSRRRLLARGSAGLAAVAALGGCSGIGLVNTVAPKGRVERAGGLAYGPAARHKLDLYLPLAAGGAPAPPLASIVFFYGGSWRDGDRQDYAFVGYGLARRGYAVAIADYRLVPDILYPAFVQDAALAVAWAAGAEGQSAGLGGRLFVAGHSAGAHIAAMLALDARFLQGRGLEPETVMAGWIGLSGPYDFLPFDDPDVAEVFSAVVPEASQPILQVGPGDAGPPALLVTGLDDTTVRPRNTQNLAAAIRQAGGSVTVETYAGVAHAGTILALTPAFAGRAPVLDAIDRFVGQGAV